MAYQRTRWQNGAAGQTTINAARLNNIEDFNAGTDVRLDSLEATVSGLGAGPTQEAPTWQTLAGKPAFVAAGAAPHRSWLSSTTPPPHQGPGRSPDSPTPPPAPQSHGKTSPSQRQKEP